MGTSAIILMLVSMLLIWGGLVLAIVNLVTRSPQEPTPEDVEAVHRDL